MSNSITTLAISTYENRTTPSPHTSYQIVIRGPVRQWTVWRRYSDFDALFQALSAISPSVPPLPPKQWSVFGSMSSEKLDDRRRGLESWCQEILKGDDRLKGSKAWLDFMAVPESARTSSHRPSFQSSMFTPESWMDEYRTLHSLARQLRAGGLKDVRGVRALESRVAALDDGLKSLKDALPKGEQERRFGLVDNLKRVSSELLNRGGTSNHHPQGAGLSGQPVISETGARGELLGHRSQSSTSSTVSSSRRFGVRSSAPSETSQTLALDNEGLLQLQRQKMNDQDGALTQLESIVRRQKELGFTIGRELDVQNELLGDLDHQVEGVQGRVKGVDKKLGKVMRG
ncbi:hypothetical protein HDU85_002779 [Gaertneriomyces sp. JEL0708]|nr:hypothetical protein HDU85_002779 [Gaertneriomyces sp. JEL0708]